MEADPKISSVIIDDKNNLKMRVMDEVDKEYVENIISKFNVEIVSAKDDYPVFIDTGNPKEDEKRLATERKKWQEAHPEEWKKMLENRNK